MPVGRQHAPRQVHAERGQPGVRQDAEEVPGPTGQVEDPGAGRQPEGPGRLLAPPDVEPEGHHAVDQVVARGDGVEHGPDQGGLLRAGRAGRPPRPGPRRRSPGAGAGRRGRDGADRRPSAADGERSSPGTPESPVGSVGHCHRRPRPTWSPMARRSASEPTCSTWSRATLTSGPGEVVTHQGVHRREQLGVGLQQAVDVRLVTGSGPVVRSSSAGGWLGLAERAPHVGREHGHRLPGHRLGGLVVAAGQVEQGREGDAPLQQQQPGLGGGHVVVGVAVLATRAGGG